MVKKGELHQHPVVEKLLDKETFGRSGLKKARSRENADAVVN